MASGNVIRVYDMFDTTGSTYFAGLRPNAGSTGSSPTGFDALVVQNNNGGSGSYTLYRDTAAPSGTISVNSGAAFSKSTSVTLNLSAANPTAGDPVSDVRFSNDGTAFGAWVPFAASASYTLPSGDGSRTVFVQWMWTRSWSSDNPHRVDGRPAAARGGPPVVRAGPPEPHARRRHPGEPVRRSRACRARAGLGVEGLGDMSARYDCKDAAQRAAGISEATAALRKGELAVLPTDTVYGVAADAFTPEAVTALLGAKGRGRQMPPPVLVGSRRAALALVENVSTSGNDLIDEFWPGGLTLVFRSARSLVWDLGDTKGTVAVRMPMQPIALDLLRETGPLAVSSANLTGSPPATTAAGAQSQLGDAVSVYLDDGPCTADVPSTIVDLTGPVPRLLRRGVIPVRRLREVVALIVDDGEEEDA
jgi:L-threonylcarbamoyladenylate synthase